MKVQIGTLQPTIEYFDNSYVAPQGTFVSLNENLKIDPFVYRSQDPNFFKLVLSWLFVLKNNDTRKDVLRLNAEHEFIMEIDGNNDEEIISNMIATSHMHLDDEIKRILKPTTLNYSLKWVDFKPAAKNILSLAQKPR